MTFNLEDNDIVFTTYEIVSREIDGSLDDPRKSDSPLARIKWKRVILDEAHRIKNHNTKANKSICAIRCKYRIAITGTPIQNSLGDFYSLIKFLRLAPLDDYTLWQYVFAEKSKAKVNPNSQESTEREKRVNSWLYILSEMVVLRRTKMDNKVGSNEKIVDLPEKKIEIVTVKLVGQEKFIYEKIFQESKDKVKKFLQYKGGMKADVNVSDILVYLLRLRQACCHMSLLSECLDMGELQNMKADAEGIDGLMQNLSINSGASSISDVSVNDTYGDCMGKTFLSSKVGKIVEMIDETMENFPEDKLIIVSQWTSMLSIIANHLQQRHLDYYEIRGDVNLIKRNEIVEKLNNRKSIDVRILLLSLNAGGVGLNLVGANRMFLVDIHWNPALEQQACDRIFRIGQTKDVFIYRFICENTIEERIMQMQQSKIEMAQRVLTAGSMASAPRSAKFFINNIKLLFSD